MGSPITVRQIAAAVTAGTAALVVLGLQPLLYAAYVMEGRATEPQLGLLAAAEILGIAVFSGLCVRLSRRFRTPAIALPGIALMVLGNLVPIGEGQSALLFLSRCIAGCGAGLLVGLASLAIAQTQRVGFWAGVFLFAQAASQFAVMRCIAVYWPGAPSPGVQSVLALIALGVAALLPLLPDRFHRPSGDPAETADLALTARGVAGLAAMFLCIGGCGGIWAYLEVWMHSRGVPQSDGAYLLSICLAGQIVGALGGAVLADGRWAWAGLLAVLTGMIASIAWWLESPGSPVLAFGFGAAFMLAAPAFTGLLAALDPSRRALPFGATAQLLGVALIPTVAGGAFAAESLTSVILACTAAIAAAALLLLTQVPFLLDRSRRPAGDVTA